MSGRKSIHDGWTPQPHEQEQPGDPAVAEPLTPRTEAGKLLVRQITHGVATRWMDEHVVAIEQEAADAARAAAPSGEPDIHRAGTDTYCPVVGVHEHPFRGPHHFREWDPDTYEPPAPDRAGLREDFDELDRLVRQYVSLAGRGHDEQVIITALDAFRAALHREDSRRG